MKKIIYREFQTQDQDKIQSLVSIGLRNTAINQNLNIQARIEKYINESQESDLGHIDEYFKNGIFFVAEYKNEIVDTKRINKILNNIKKKSIQNKIDPKITKRIWINMIYAYIDFEKRNFKKK